MTKKYVWDKKLIMKINKGRRTTDINPKTTQDRRKREFCVHVPVVDRRTAKRDRRS